MRTPARLGAALVLTACAVAGCRPAQPSAHEWLTSTSTTVGDVLSEVSTTRITLQQLQRDRFVGRYSPVVLVYAEDNTAKALNQVTAEQPPASERERWRDVVSTLQDASGSVTEARVAVVAGDSDSYADLEDQLGETAKVLSKLQSRLEKAAKQ